MSYATLMVHLEPGRANRGPLRMARSLADRFQAGVIGIAARQPMQLSYGDGYAYGELLQQDREQTTAALKAAEAEFRSALGVRSQAVEWRSAVTYASLTDYIACEARSADLLITGVATGDFFDASRNVNTGELVMQAGRPVLVVPTSMTAALPAAPATAAQPVRLARVLVGWKETRESRRAIADALPLLQGALHVTVAEIAAEDDLHAARTRLADVVAWLKCHGVTAVPRAVAEAGGDVPQLAAIAREQAADLVVAGAYGHSRLREWVLGGVTRDLLRGAGPCALVSH